VGRRGGIGRDGRGEVSERGGVGGEEGRKVG